MSTVSATTRDYVFERDGTECWLCGMGLRELLQSAHQLGASGQAWFETYRTMGIIPQRVTSLSHADNIITLCHTCHHAYDLEAPFWFMLPTAETLQLYLEHERRDYESRQRAGRRSVAQRRTLPEVDREAVQYQPYVLQQAFAEGYRFSPAAWPKGWAGEPTTAILKGVRGLHQPCNPVPVKGSGEDLVLGVPADMRTKVSQLVNLWSRPPPEVVPKGEPFRKKLRSSGHSGAGGESGAGGAGHGGGSAGTGKKRVIPVQKSDRVLRLGERGIGAAAAVCGAGGMGEEGLGENYGALTGSRIRNAVESWLVHVKASPAEEEEEEEWVVND